MAAYLLNVIIFLPLVGALGLLFIPRTQSQTIERVAIGASFLSLVGSAFAWGSYYSSPGLQNGFSREWIPALHIRYSIGVDGFSMPMVLLTALLSTCCLIYSAGRIKTRTREYFIFMLLLECFLLGVFCARDLFLFYVLFDASLVPMYFLIAIWGGERRAYAALKFFLYTLAGSAALLIGVLWVYFQSLALGEPTFDIQRLAQLNLFHNMPQAQSILFFLFGVAFLVKMPIFPFHTWLPDAYVEAPSAVTSMLAGAMGKMGVYGFLRLALPFFPEGAHRWAQPLMVLAVISIIYGALVALAQWDLKRLVAYSSVSHMGFIALGIAAAAAASVHPGRYGGGDPGGVATSGVLFEMFGHGIITGGLFLLVGMLSERAGERDLRLLTGAMKRAPVFVVIFAIFMFGSMAMPGLIGFWGELYILLGAFPMFRFGTALSALGIAITAGFFIWALQRMAFGETTRATENLTDIKAAEVYSIAPLLFLMFFFGLLPGFYLTPWVNAINELGMFLVRH